MEAMHMILLALVVDFTVACLAMALAGLTVPVTLPSHDSLYPLQEHKLFVGGWIALAIGWVGVLRMVSWVFPVDTPAYAPTCMLAIALLTGASLVAIKANREAWLIYRQPCIEHDGKAKEAAA